MIIPGRRPVGADLDRRHGSVRHRQHEAGAERRADHRHARRRQHRDPRPCRRGEHRDLRHGGDGGGGAPGAGLDATDVISRSPRLARAIRAIECGVFSPDDPGRFAAIAHALRHLDHYMVSADFDAYYEAQRGIDARWQRRLGLDPCRHPQHRADGVVLLRPHHPRIRRRHLGRADNRAGGRRSRGRRSARTTAASRSQGGPWGRPYYDRPGHENGSALRQLRC